MQGPDNSRDSVSDKNSSDGGSLSDTVRAKTNPDVHPLLERLLKTAGAPEISDKNKIELSNLLASMDLTKDKPEEDPRALEAVCKQLDDWGYKRIPTGRELTTTTKSHELANTINEYSICSKMPGSNVGIYSFEATMLGDKISWVKTGKNRVIDWAENFLKKSGDLGGNVLTCLFSTSKRSKTDIHGVAKNIHELGLEEYFQETKDGDKVVSVNETYKYTEQKERMLDDLLRANENSQLPPGELDYLRTFNKAEAIAAGAEMLDEVHKKANRGLGEVLTNDIVFRIENGKIVGARPALPDVAYDPDVAPVEQKAYDLLDYCFSVGSAGMQAGGETEADDFVTTVLSNYSDPQVRAKAKKLVVSGLPQLTLHNRARLGFDNLPDAAKAHQHISEKVSSLL